MRPTRPRLSTLIPVVKAALSVGGFTSFGSDHVPAAPPWVDVEIRSMSFWKLFGRPSCQTTYSWPLFGSMAKDGTMSPVRIGFVGSRGSTTPQAQPGTRFSAVVKRRWTSTGADQVVPWSLEE